MYEKLYKNTHATDLARAYPPKAVDLCIIAASVLPHALIKPGMRQIKVGW